MGEEVWGAAKKTGRDTSSGVNVNVMWLWWKKYSNNLLKGKHFFLLFVPIFVNMS